MLNHASFYSDHTTLRAVIDACLEGLAGRIVSVSGVPAALRLDVGCYAVLGGDAASPDARLLVEQAPRGQELVYVGSDWEHLIQSVFPSAADRSMMTFVPGPACRDKAREHLGRLLDQFSIESLMPFHDVPAHLTPNGFQVVESSDAFFDNGFGFFAALGGEMAALTTTYTLSTDKAEIAISTDPRFRNKGLAASLASAIVLECFRRGLTPHWSASNPVSQRLARRVGLVDHGPCRVLEVPKLDARNRKKGKIQT